MKTNLFLLLSFLTMIITSCRNDDFNERITLSYDVIVEYPELYNTLKAENATVVLKNLSTNTEVSINTNANGVASFANLTPGIYSINVSKNLSAADAEKLTGISQEVFLNATLAQVQITAYGTQTIKLEGSSVGNWVIKEFYYSGAPNSYYFYDGFIEIYNNSTTTLYADGLMLGNTKSATASAASTYGFITQGETDVYLAWALKIPGKGTDHPVAPGKSIIIAIDGINHKDDPNGNPNSPVNLGAGIADFEVYFDLNPKTPDTDTPDVPNVEVLYAFQTTIFDYIPGVMGSGLVIFNSPNIATYQKYTEPNSTSSNQYLRIPKEDIIDGLDAVANATVTPERKRLPINIDAGMNTVGKAYSGTSLRRKVKQDIGGRKVLLDTNNSTNDFEATTKPTPKGW